MANVNKSGLTTKAWLQFDDRNSYPYNPIASANVIVSDFRYAADGDPRTDHWIVDEWAVNSVLVPLDGLDQALKHITYHADLKFDLGWNLDDRFEFGERYTINGVEVRPLCLEYKHPVTEQVTLELDRRFVLYHSLKEGERGHYSHPLDHTTVATLEIRSQEFYNPTGTVIVQRSYLRDFLAAIGCALVVASTSDRFANSPDAKELPDDNFDSHLIDDRIFLSMRVHSPNPPHEHWWQARSTLKRVQILYPFDKPQFERSPWHFYGKIQDSSDQTPRFVCDSDGNKVPLTASEPIGQYGFLFFRPEVLDRFLRVEGYWVRFHMRTWGFAAVPGSHSGIQLGINEIGLVSAFWKDLADLTIKEQSYWASFSCIPEGRVCHEMFETIVQQNPPFSPSVPELFETAREKFSRSFEVKFKIAIFSEHSPNERELQRLSVGPLHQGFDEVLDLSKLLYGWLIETMSLETLRKAIGKPVNKEFRQIRLLEELLVSLGKTPIEARKLTAPLAALNELRVSAAHIGSSKLQPAFEILGEPRVPAKPRVAWDYIVNHVHSVLCEMAHTVSALTET